LALKEIIDLRAARHDSTSTRAEDRAGSHTWPRRSGPLCA